MLIDKLDKIFNRIPILGFQGTTLIDYPDVISSILFTGYCNLTCPYCHNRDLVEVNSETMTKMPASYFISEMKKRAKIVKGVNITGGEPLLYGNDIIELCKFIKEELGLKVKVDTNGTKFETLYDLVNSGFVDYIAMDVKTIISKYSIVGVKSEEELSNIKQSIEFLKNQDSVKYEYRITLSKSILELTDVEEYGNLVKGGEKLFIQQFTPVNTLDPTWIDEQPYSIDEVKKISEILNHFIPTSIRGI